MSGLVFMADAIKVVNKGGGHPTRTIIRERKDRFGRVRRWKEHQSKDKRAPGADHLIFKCPVCNQRNNRPVQHAKGETADGRLCFTCNRCYREIEVARPRQRIIRPTAPMEKPRQIITP